MCGTTRRKGGKHQENEVNIIDTDFGGNIEQIEKIPILSTFPSFKYDSLSTCASYL